MPPSAALRFSSERFDYKSELPVEYNAGNRFYGKDVAEFLAAQLGDLGFAADYLDEDWGWLVFSAKGVTPQFEVAIYNLAEHGEGGRPGIAEWGLWIRGFERHKVLGLLPKRSAIAPSQSLRSAVKAAVSAAGAEANDWEAGPQ